MSYHIELILYDVSDIIEQMVQGSVNSWTTKLYDQFQYLTNGIL